MGKGALNEGRDRSPGNTCLAGRLSSCVHLRSTKAGTVAPATQAVKTKYGEEITAQRRPGP